MTISFGVAYVFAYLFALLFSLLAIAMETFMLFYAVFLIREKEKRWNHKLFCIMVITWTIVSLIKLIGFLFSIHSVTMTVLGQVR